MARCASAVDGEYGTRVGWQAQATPIPLTHRRAARCSLRRTAASAPHLQRLPPKSRREARSGTQGRDGTRKLTIRVPTQSALIGVAVISAKNHKRRRRKRQSVTAEREKSQTPKKGLNRNTNLT